MEETETVTEICNICHGQGWIISGGSGKYGDSKHACHVAIYHPCWWCQGTGFVDHKYCISLSKKSEKKKE